MPASLAMDELALLCLPDLEKLLLVWGGGGSKRRENIVRSTITGVGCLLLSPPGSARSLDEPLTRSENTGPSLGLLR
jgi:hypothetical protein